MLKHGFEKLPNITRVEYDSHRIYKDRRTIPALNSLGATEREILVGPETFHRYLESEGHFWTLQTSAWESGHTHNIADVRGSGLDLIR
jgi:hypothetical protein